MKFTHIHNNDYGSEIESITMELHEHATLDQVLESFTRFVRACGYHFEGSVDIVDHEAELDDYLHDHYNDEPVVDELDEIDDDVLKANADWPVPLSTKP